MLQTAADSVILVTKHTRAVKQRFSVVRLSWSYIKVEEKDGMQERQQMG